jgi:hypothetical protein
LQLNFAIELVSGQPSSVTIFAFFPMLLEPKAKAAVAKPKDVPISKSIRFKIGGDSE